MTDEKKYREMLKKKDEEIAELKELLAEAETELKELNDFHGFAKPPKGTILESQFLNKLIKRTAFFLICVVIVLIGLYPWFFKNTLLGDDASVAENIPTDTAEVMETDAMAEPTIDSEPVANSATDDIKTAETSEGKDIFSKQQVIEVVSDLGWLNVRTEPNVETGDVIKKINSGEEYEWVEKTEDNWYKLVIDDAGHTGYVSGEYVEEK